MATKRQSIDNSMIRFPKLDACAHFHYEFAELPNFNASLMVNSAGKALLQPNLFVQVQCGESSWIIRRNLKDFAFLDAQLHKCVFDRQHSKLNALPLTTFSALDTSTIELISDYLKRFSHIVGGFLTCGQLLHWFELDNRGKHLLNEESDINTPAVGAAFVVKQHVKSNMETEISLEVGELVSVIEMPPISESFFWKGKKGLEVGYFPAECVRLFDDKITDSLNEYAFRPLQLYYTPASLHASHKRHSELFGVFENVGENKENMEHFRSSANNRYGILAAFLRSFGSHRTQSSRRAQLKPLRDGLRERVFACDLCEHLSSSVHNIPLVLVECCRYIERYGLEANGIYRLSGVGSSINRLRAKFDEEHTPDEMLESSGCELVDIHAVTSLLKLYFRELPNPLLTYSLYNSFIQVMRDDNLDHKARLCNIRLLVISLPPPHWRTLRFLIRHLSYVSNFASKTGMTSKNLAIVWAPNLLRSRDLDLVINIEALQLIATQAVLTEFFIANCDEIFNREEHEIHPPKPLYSPNTDSQLNDSKIQFKNVGPVIVPGKYHTVIQYLPCQPKRSKFVLSNLRKLHFFSTRTHNAQHGTDTTLLRKPSTTFSAKEERNTEDDDDYDDNRNNNVHQTDCVKRSHSFDSYFKKLRTNDSIESNNNNHQTEDENNQVNEHRLFDMKQKERRHTDAILEVDETTLQQNIPASHDELEIIDNFKNETLSHIHLLYDRSQQDSQTVENSSSTSSDIPATVPIAECETSDSSEQSSLLDSQTIAYIDEVSTSSPVQHIKSNTLVRDAKEEAKCPSSQETMLTTHNNTHNHSPKHQDVKSAEDVNSSPQRVVLRDSARRGENAPGRSESRPSRSESRPSSLVLPQVGNSSPRAFESGSVRIRTSVSYRRSETFCKPTRAASHESSSKLSVEVKTKASTPVASKVDHRRFVCNPSPVRNNPQVKLRHPVTTNKASEADASAAKAKTSTIECTPLRRINRRQRIIGDSAAIVHKFESQTRTSSKM